MARKIRIFINWISGMKLRYRMFFIYIIGGALPSLLIGLYLVNGMSRILIEQAKDAEVTEMEAVRRQLEDMAGTVSTVTKYFYFDSRLEEISAKSYGDYGEMVQDYREFTAFLDYGRYYNNTIAWINIYMENSTIVGNSRFIKVTEEMAGEEWYALAKKKNGGAVWRFRPVPAAGYDALGLFRMLKTQKGGDVGVLAVYIRPGQFEVLLQERGCGTLVVLNNETVVASAGGGPGFEEVKALLPGKESGQVQKNIFLGREEYVMTCETIPLTEAEDYLQVVSFKAYKDILRDVGAQTAKSMAFYILSAVASVTVIILFSRSFSGRVERFLAQMQKAASGNFELEEKLGGSDEISDLYDYLGTMIYQIQRLLAEVYQERLRAERLTIQQKDAEFKMLASQINPHFLYNTLETVRMRARRSGQRDIEEIVQMLAKIMRSTLQAGGSEIALRSEVELVEHYLKIQQYRFGERIQYSIYVEEGLEELPILPLIMQPVVENSIIHGLEGKEGVGTISIDIREREKNVVISIFDDGLGMSREALLNLRNSLNTYNEKGRHIGVGNVHQRVRLKYGDDYGVTIDSEEGSYTRVEILLPDAAELGESMYV